MKYVILFFMIVITCSTFGQVFSNKEVGKKNQALADSLKQSEYPYSLPIWGAKAHKRGYNLPLPAGLSMQYFGTESSLIINNLSVGFNYGEKYNLDGIVRFDEAKARGSSLTVRPDIMLFPFLTVYGILGKSQASTDVGFGVWVPDGSGEDQQVLSASTIVDFNTTTFGIGMMPQIGIGGGFMVLDMNMAWTDVPQLSKPARSFVIAPRWGKAFKLKKPNQVVTIWVGAFRASIASGTDGSLSLSEVLPADFGAKVDQGIQKVGDAQVQVDTWWNSLTPPQQNNPVNKAKYETANKVLARAGQIFDAADRATDNISNSTVQYSMTKQMKDLWNFIVGSQFQFNKHWMIRGEAGFLGSRKQFIVGWQYRFGL